MRASLLDLHTSSSRGTMPYINAHLPRSCHITGKRFSQIGPVCFVRDIVGEEEQNFEVTYRIYVPHTAFALECLIGL